MAGAELEACQKACLNHENCSAITWPACTLQRSQDVVFDEIGTVFLRPWTSKYTCEELGWKIPEGLNGVESKCSFVAEDCDKNAQGTQHNVGDHCKKSGGRLCTFAEIGDNRLVPNADCDSSSVWSSTGCKRHKDGHFLTTHALAGSTEIVVDDRECAKTPGVTCDEDEPTRDPPRARL